MTKPPNLPSNPPYPAAQYLKPPALKPSPPQPKVRSKTKPDCDKTDQKLDCDKTQPNCDNVEKPCKPAKPCKPKTNVVHTMLPLT